MRPLLFLLLLLFASLSSATLNGTYCQSYASPGLVFPAPLSTQTLYAQGLCLQFLDTNTVNVSVFPYVQTSGVAQVEGYLSLLSGLRADLSSRSGLVSGLLPRYDLLLNAVVTGVGAPTQLMLTAVNDRCALLKDS